MVSRSSAAGNSIMPPTANMVSGNTSVWAIPALMAVFSARLPGIEEACGVNASRPAATHPDGPEPSGLGSRRRSAINSTPMIANPTMAPCNSRAGRSTATAPTAASCPVPGPMVL